MSPTLMLMLTGCVQTVRFPPDLWRWDSGGRRIDTAVEIDPVLVQTIDYGCEADQASWLFNATTDGWIGSAVLGIYESGHPSAWEEEHDMEIVDSAPNGSWDLLETGPLTHAMEPEMWEPNVSTVLSCTDTTVDPSFSIRVWDHLGNLSDCVTWGAEPELIAVRFSTDPEVSMIGGCLPLYP